jgi:hypothetical protein
MDGEALETCLPLYLGRCAGMRYDFLHDFFTLVEDVPKGSESAIGGACQLTA